MKLDDALTFFGPKGAKIKIANSLGLTSGAISQWGEVIPKKSAYELERITDGELKVDHSLYIKEAKPQKAN